MHIQTMKSNIFLFVLLTNYMVFSQTLKNIKGKINATFEIPEGVHISNKTKGFFTVSNSKGIFFINASVNDTIKLTAVNVMDCQLIISKNDFESGQIFPELKENIVRLDEVTLTGFQKIDLVKMGVISKNIKEYTPAEKKLFFARTGSINLIYSLLSGDYKRIKKEIEYEKKIYLIEKIHNRFADSFFVNELKIPSINVKGFVVFCAEDETFADAFETETTQILKFLMMEKSYKYLEFIKKL